VSYALRNSLILIGLLVVVLAVGFYWVGVRQVAQVEALTATQEQVQGQLNDIHSVISIYDTTQAQLNSLKARSQARNQIVPPADTPAQTLAYLHELLALPGASVKFDFLYKGREDAAEYSMNQYALEGEGRFENLYAFTWHLEHGRRFYGVDHIEVEYVELEAEETGQNWVDFKLVFRSYFEPQSQVEELSPSKGTLRPDVLVRNPFRPLITQTIPPNLLGLFEVSGARLGGVTHDLAYLIDSRGQTYLLREGDRVYLGRLSKIDIVHNRVEFRLNLGGISERVVLEAEIE
jgi:Tfp pilus assembly protein PilO